MVGPLVLTRESYQCNTTWVRRCTPTGHRRWSLQNVSTYRQNSKHDNLFTVSKIANFCQLPIVCFLEILHHHWLKTNHLTRRGLYTLILMLTIIMHPWLSTHWLVRCCLYKLFLIFSRFDLTVRFWIFYIIHE